MADETSVAAVKNPARDLSYAQFWYYHDASGARQGPFHPGPMRDWFVAGYLPETTPVAPSFDGAAPCSSSFRTIAALFLSMPPPPGESSPPLNEEPPPPGEEPPPPGEEPPSSDEEPLPPGEELPSSPALAPPDCIRPDALGAGTIGPADSLGAFAFVSHPSVARYPFAVPPTEAALAAVATVTAGDEEEEAPPTMVIEGDRPTAEVAWIATARLKAARDLEEAAREMTGRLSGKGGGSGGARPLMTGAVPMKDLPLPELPLHTGPAMLQDVQWEDARFEGMKPYNSVLWND